MGKLRVTRMTPTSLPPPGKGEGISSKEVWAVIRLARRSEGLPDLLFSIDRKALVQIAFFASFSIWRSILSEVLRPGLRYSGHRSAA